MGKIISLYVSNMIYNEWNSRGNKIQKGQEKLNVENTYLIIFNKQGQEQMYKKFLEFWGDEINILFESDWMVNLRYSKVQKRNKIIVFEKKE